MGAGWGDGGLVKAAPECVIEFFPFPSSLLSGPACVSGHLSLEPTQR